MRDTIGRSITYLRVSVTDRCNLRCAYCVPQRDFTWIPHDQILTFEEIYRVCEAFSRLGIRKIRLTGGEPLVRKGVTGLAERLRDLAGVEELCMTTNGVFLKENAQRLFEAGITHINISLDTLQPERFRHITGHDFLGRVKAGIEQVVSLGFPVVKVNTVVMKGINEDELVPLARQTLSSPLQWRFIEFMPVGASTSWEPERMVSCHEMKRKIEEALGPLEPVQGKELAGPAEIFRLAGAMGTLGFISPVSSHFCGTCNRLRLTAEGRLRLCLFSDDEIEVRGLLRGGVDSRELEEFLKRSILQKPVGLSGRAQDQSCRRIMTAIGG